MKPRPYWSELSLPEMKAQSFTAVQERDGWQYLFFNQRQIWDDAQEICSNNTANLASITSKEEEDFLQRFLPKYIYHRLRKEGWGVVAPSLGFWVKVYEKSTSCQQLPAAIKRGYFIVLVVRDSEFSLVHARNIPKTVFLCA